MSVRTPTTTTRLARLADASAPRDAEDGLMRGKKLYAHPERVT